MNRPVSASRIAVWSAACFVFRAGKPAGASKRGASLLEFALTLPLLIVLIANVVNFAGYFFAWITVQDAARAGAQYLVRGPMAWGDPAPAVPAFASVSPIVTQDVSSLLNNSSLALRVCTRNKSGGAIQTVTCSVVTGSFATTPSNPPADASAEASNFVLAWVDVAYTYKAFIPSGLTFPGLGFGPVWPSNSNGVVIHRQVAMRILQ